MNTSEDEASPENVPLFLTCRELALRWRLSSKSIHNLVRAGKVRALRIGSTLRFTREDIRAAEARAATTAAAEGGES